MLVPAAVSTMLGLGFLYFPVRSTFLMTTLMALSSASCGPKCLLHTASSGRRSVTSCLISTCYVCSLLYGAYQMMLTTAGTLCNVITDNQVSQPVACTVTGAAQSHEQHSAPAFQQSLGVYLCMRSHARYERKSLSHILLCC